MPLRLEIKRKLCARSDRVKSVDIHPTEPWVLASLYNGHVYVWNYVTQALVKTFEVTELPVRIAKFVYRKQWMIAGADDMQVRVYNYNTMEKVKSFEAHSDYIRSIAVHPTQSLLLTSSDDMTIKLWDWDKNWSNIQVFEGHSHYVMQVMFNPKDPNTFASASLDRSVKVWSIGATVPNFTLEGHEKGINTIDYFTGGEKPYLLTGSDDKTVKIWDYQNKSCVQTLEGHSHNVAVVAFHPELPLILSGSEDGTVRLWHSGTYRLENTLNYGLERTWAIACQKGSNKVAIGYDEGSVLIKLGREEPIASMDQSGKIIWSRHMEIQSANIKAVGDAPVSDGERLPLATKELGNTEVYPQSLKHNPNGRFVVMCGDGEYTIYTALAWRNKTFGSALEFVWAQGSGGDYAVRESSSKIKTFKNFKEHKNFKPPFNVEGIYGGSLIAMRSSSFVCLYDWEECRLVRRIDVVPKHVIWSENGEYVCIACDASFYILRFNRESAMAQLESGVELPDDGIEDAFEVIQEINERVMTATWIGDCFVYTSSTGRLNYTIGGETITISHLDRPLYILGFIPKESRVYLIDREYTIVSYFLPIAVIEYQTAIVRKDFEAAEKVLPNIPVDHMSRTARFLETQGLPELALRVSQDPEHKFDLAIQLGDLDVAREIADIANNEQKWKQLGDLAIQTWKFDLAEASFVAAQDFSALLLLYSSTGNVEGLNKLGDMAREAGKQNVAFVCYFSAGRLEECIEVLRSSGRVPEAAFFSRSYLPSKISEILKVWKEELQLVNKKAADSLADPLEYENLFPDLVMVNIIFSTIVSFISAQVNS
eukprot:TRINITY_DN1256_c0_g1_i3.p1 TRINITY_DN1256_c0_g1~~TRINITY_DN1256_c0_g1_i3.p1  ORF type:complete len:823 (-),score=163.17 TRINITY_DN1256_c0_g1_i3:43-2511(-)